MENQYNNGIIKLIKESEKTITLPLLKKEKFFEKMFDMIANEYKKKSESFISKNKEMERRHFIIKKVREGKKKFDKAKTSREKRRIEKEYEKYTNQINW